MKNFHYFLLAFILCIKVNAQTVPAGENISLDQQLSNINQASVTSGIIYERVMQISNLYNFNQSTTFNTANFSYFKQSLMEMNRASNGLKFNTLQNFKNMIATTILDSEVDVAILNTQFNILNYNEDNPSLGGLTYNPTTFKFAQISGAVPFYMLHNTVVSPAKDNVSGSAVTYKIRNDLFFQNGTKTIKTLTANFGDGVNRTLISNGIFTNQNCIVNYTSSGEKISTYTITYSDNTTLTTYGKIYFNYVSNDPTYRTQAISCSPNTQDFDLQADISFTGYEVGDPTIKSKIKYRIYYANTDRKIRKPIIIIDGFDPGDKRKFEDCDCEADKDCADINTTNGVFDPLKHRAMVDLMEYYDLNQTKVNLIPQLRALGYDIIMVNHPKYTTTNLQNNQQVAIDGGAYYIESNAMALVKLISQTKQLLTTNGSANQIAIVGPSMGGQISRYALAYMEKNNIPHNTYLWISVDSPHLGANIPMGDQALLNLAKKFSDEAKDFYENDLASPAGQQQLIEFHKEKVEYVTLFGTTFPVNNYHLVDQNYLNAQTASQGLPLDRGNSYFQQHYNNQNSNGLPNSHGWPVNLRKIALVNGSLSGSKAAVALNGQQFTPFANDGEKVLNLRGFQRITIPLLIGQITMRVHIASLEVNYMPLVGNESRIARLKKHFDDKTTKATNINSRGNMDNVPGGFLDAQNLIAGPILGKDPVPGVNLYNTSNWSLSNISIENIFRSISERLGGSYWDVAAFNPIHSFISTFSALGHLQPNQNWSNPLNTNLTCSSNKLTPFDSYFGTDKNSQHTSFNKESVDWLLKELAGQPQTPSFPIQGNQLTGASAVCLGVNATYTFADICKIPSTATWTVTSNIQIVSSTGYSVTVSGLSGGNATITATFQNGLTYTKTIWVGTPSRPTFLRGPATVNTGALVNYSGGTSIGATSYEWWLPYPYDTVDVFDYFGYNWQKLTNYSDSNTVQVFTGYAQNSGLIQFMGKNACGCGGVVSMAVSHGNIGPGGGGTPRLANPENAWYTIYPNPSTDIINVALVNETQKPETTSVIMAELYDIQGQPRRKVQVKNNTASISVSGLPKGVYILNINIDEITEGHQIIVE